MKQNIIIFALFSCFLICPAYADSNSNSTSTNVPDKAALEAALKDCVSTVSKDSNGKPDFQSVDVCMTKKGFSRPDGHPPVK